MRINKSNWKIWYLSYKLRIQIVATLLAVVLIVIVWMLIYPAPNPIPKNIQMETNFKIIYPTGYTIDQNSWNYSSSQNNLNFSAKKANYSVVITEQQTPLAYQNDQAAYERFIGSLKPTAVFNAPIGSVSLTYFVTSSDFQLEGETGILNAKGTFVLVHPNSTLTDNEWRDLFNSLKVSN